MTQAIIDFFLSVFHNAAISTFLISTVPVIELRGAIPFAMHYYKMPFYQALLLGILGGMAVCVLLLLCLTPVFRWMKKTRIFAKIVGFFERKFQKKSSEIEKKAEEANAGEKRANWIKFFSVLTFVAIPLPGTGVWTGTAIAVFLNMKPPKAFAAITVGNLIAGLLVSAISALF